VGLHASHDVTLLPAGPRREPARLASDGLFAFSLGHRDVDHGMGVGVALVSSFWISASACD
jgi:hypothetical protein